MILYDASNNKEKEDNFTSICGIFFLCKNIKVKEHEISKRLKWVGHSRSPYNFSSIKRHLPLRK